MANFSKVADEVFKILRTYSYTCLLYDAKGADVQEPTEARRFFAKKDNLMVSIVEDNDDSRVSLQYGPTTHANDIMGLDQALRALATKYALSFKGQQAGEEIEPKDFPAMASITERRRKMVSSLTEGMYGTSCSSYLRLENARMVVRHSKRIDDQQIGARGRHVESIFIENAAGERLLFPSRQLAPARAMTQHVNHGGGFADTVGSQIIEMAGDYANLAHASNFIATHAVSLSEDVTPVREACRGKMCKLRKTFERLAKPSSYMIECDNVEQRSKTLTETDDAIDETRLAGVRRLLNDADLPNGVYECMCKAVDEMKEDKPINEVQDEDADEEDVYVPPRRAKKVLGQMVDTAAWDLFAKAGELPLRGQPISTKQQPMFGSRYAELCYKLGNLVPQVQDESMQRLLQFVLDDLTDYGEHEVVHPEEQPGKRKPQDQDQHARQHVKNIIQIAVRALKAARMGFTSDLARRGPVKEYLDWLDRFHPDYVLAEDRSMDPMSTSGGMDFGDAYGQVLGDIVENFDAADFVESPEILDEIDNRDPHDPDENHLTHDEVMGALRAYLERQGRTYSHGFDFVFDGDTSELADQLYDRAVEAVQDLGFVVENDTNVEQMSEGLLEDDEVLSAEDILINKPDQGDGLAREVTKTMVTDPDTNRKRPPDANYISRLHTLGAMTMGPNGQSY